MRCSDKVRFLGLLLILNTAAPSGGLCGRAAAAGASGTWSVRMAQSIMKRNPGSFGYWDYVTGTVLAAFAELWKATGDPVYYQYLKATVDRAVGANGSIFGYRLTDYNLDQINEGRMVLLLHQRTGESKYKTAVDLLRSQLKTHPRTSDGGFWHKQVYPWQMWQDGLYMAGPFYAEYGKAYDEPGDFDDAVRQILLMEKHARDPKTGLLYHGWDEKKEQTWANPETGCSASFWGRAMGWYAMAVVDVLGGLPPAHAGRDSVAGVLVRLAEAVARVQEDSTGVWYQVLDQAGRTGNYRESSASCMFVYALLKGVRLGILDPRVLPAARKGFEGIIRRFITENSDGTVNLTRTCLTAGLGNGRDGSFDYYVRQTQISSNDGKAMGPFILAGLEMEALETRVGSKIPPASTESIGPVLTVQPNPCNPSASVAYSLPGPGRVVLSLFDVRGREMLRSAPGWQPEGRHRLTLDVSDLPCGVYALVLQFGSATVTRKITVLK
jgi:unsaturated rhamnogalacturonyl hydrolase